MGDTQGKLDLLTEVDAVTLAWPLGMDYDGIVECDGYLPPVPDKRCKNGLRLRLCGATLEFGSCLLDLYESVAEHRKAVKHHGD